MNDVDDLVDAEVERRLNDPKFLRLKISDLLGQLDVAAPKVESFEALMASDKTMSITAAFKHFGLKPHKHGFPYMRTHGLLTSHDLPTEDADRLGLLVLKEAHNRTTGFVGEQAMVEARQLERWRTYLVPRIRKWTEENGQ